jgi:iron complex outermembrane receptor protein
MGHFCVVFVCMFLLKRFMSILEHKVENRMKMMRREGRVIAQCTETAARLLMIGASFALHSPALAQGSPNPADSDPAPEAEIVVTALINREATTGLFGGNKVVDTPFSVVPFTDELVRAQQLRTVAEVVVNDTSTRTIFAGASPDDRYVIRGFVSQNGDIAFEGLYGMVPARRIAVEPFASIEILKGPSTLLYGSPPTGNIGGTINVVPKRATQIPTRTATLSFESQSLFGANLDFGQRFMSDQIGIRVNAAYKEGEVAVDQVRDRRFVTSVAIDVDLERFKVTADLMYMHLKLKSQDSGIGVPSTATLIPAPPSSRINFGQPFAYYHSEFYRAVLGASYEIFDDVELKLRHGTSEQRDDAVTLSHSFTNLTVGNIVTRVFRSPVFFRQSTWDGSIRANFATGPVTHSLSAVATEFGRQTGTLSQSLSTLNSNIYNPVQFAPPANLPSSLGRARLAIDYRFSSVAALDQIGLFDDRVQVTLGVRYQDLKETNFNSATGARLFQLRTKNTSFNYAVLAKPTTETSLYFSSSEGVAQGPNVPLNAVNFGEDFGAFVSKQKEVGGKVDLGRWGGSIALFEISQPSGFLEVPSMIFRTTGLTRNRGLEISTYGQVAPGLRLIAGAAFYDPKIESSANGTFDGNLPIGAPRQLANLYAEWSPNFVAGLTMQGRITYTSGQYANASNTARIASWTRFDTGLQHKVDGLGMPLIAAIIVNNVLDTDYWQSAVSGVHRGAPRTLRMSVQADF